jgi:ketosteroid isomerase-like protein
MTTAPADLVRSFYATLAGADATPLDRYLAPDAVLDVPGDSPNAGRYRGLDEITGFLARAHAVTGGTLRLTLHDVAVGDDHVIALTTYTASRPGREPLANHLCHLLKVQGGRIVYSRFFTGDQYKTDAFWRD